MPMRGIPRFSIDALWPHSAKNFLGEPFSVSLTSGIENFYAYEGNITFLYRKFVVSQYREISLANNSVYQKFSGSGKLHA